MLNILHCHSTFALGGKEARAVALMNAFGDAARHSIISSVPDALGARDAIAPGIRVDFPGDAPLLAGRPGYRRYRALTAYMRSFDLVLSYNWGAMDAVMARRVFPGGMPPLVHHEDGFNADESERLKAKRTFLRRLALPTAAGVAVPSTTLEAIATSVWHVDPARLFRIPNGIPTRLYAAAPQRGAIPGLKRRTGEVVIGTLAGLRAVKNVPRLVRAALSMANTRLVVVGEGPERTAVAAVAASMGASDRLVLPGFLPEPHRYIGAFDVFALSSDSEQFPISLVEAMAAGLPVAATDVGDVRAMLPEAQSRFVVPCDDHKLAAALRQLVADPALRQTLGTANRALALRDYDEGAMIAAYRRLYKMALGEKGALFASATL